MYCATTTATTATSTATSVVVPQRKVQAVPQLVTTSSSVAAAPVPSSRTSVVIGLLFVVVLYAFNAHSTAIGTAGASVATFINLDSYIDYETYAQYTSSSFEMMVPSYYKVDFSSLPSLSAAIQAIQDTYGYEYTDAAKNAHNSKSQPLPSLKNTEIPTHEYYNLNLSTEENYQSSEMIFTGQYTHIRSSLDYTYHRNYLPHRQLLQDTIISNIMQINHHNANITDSNGISCSTPQNPWIVFTAGAMGSGKSYTIRHLAKSDRFPLDSFVTVDPDEIRRLLPEFEMYLDYEPEEAGERTRKEAGFIAEMLTQIALNAGRNVLVDGSLNDAKWYRDYFQILRRDYGKYGLRIGILHITAPREAVFERSRVSSKCSTKITLRRFVSNFYILYFDCSCTNQMRSKITRRVVPRHRLEETLAKVPQSVNILSPLADFVAELHNPPNAEDIELISDDLTWSSFRKVWAQSCDQLDAMTREREALNIDIGADIHSPSQQANEEEINLDMMQLRSKL